MSKTDVITRDGFVTECLANSLFRVDVDSRIIICHLSGKMRLKKIRLIEGDKVKVEFSPYDLTKGRISWRYNNSSNSQTE